MIQIFTPKERKELVRITENLVDFIHSNGIRNVVLLDRSARPAYLGISRVWAKRFPEEQKPQVYFVNPEGFNTTTRSAFQVDKDFRTTHKYLAGKSDQKTMIFDTCFHSGTTARGVLEGLTRAGFQQVYVGSTQKIERTCKIRVNFEALDYMPLKDCYPFDRDVMVEKPRDSVVSERSSFRLDKIYSRIIRREISQAFENRGY